MTARLRPGVAGALLLVGLAGDPSRAAAEGLLEPITGLSAWDQLQMSRGYAREEALADLVRTGSRELCEPLRRVIRQEGTDQELTPALLRALGQLGCRRHLPYLLQLALGTGKPRLARAAVDALGRLRDPRALPVLWRLARTRQSAAAVLALRWFGPRVGPGLKRLLGQRSRAANEASRILAVLRVPGAGRAIRDAVAYGRVEHAAGLHALGTLCGQGDAGYLARHLVHKKPEVRLAALEALGRCATPGVVPHLIAALADPTLERAALELLEGLGSRVPITPLVTLLGRSGQPRSALAIRALGVLGGRPAVAPLFHLVRRGRGHERRSALLALRYTGEPSAAALLLRVARGRSDLAPHAVVGLGTMLRPHRMSAALRRMVRQATSLLLQKARKWRGVNRLTALAMLGRIGADEALPLLRKRLTRGDIAERRIAATALGSFDDRSAGNALIRALVRDPDPIVRGEAAWSLGRHGSHFALGPLLRALRDAAFPVAINAAAALGYLGLPEAGRRLASRLGHANPTVQANVAFALARLKYRGARARLTRLARSSPRVETRIAAVRALFQIQGRRSLPTLLRLESHESDARVEQILARAIAAARGHLPPGPPGRPGRWIEYRLETRTGKPVAWRAVLIRLPDGATRAGTTGPLGLARVDEVTPGLAELTIGQRVYPPKKPARPKKRPRPRPRPRRRRPSEAR